MRRTAATVVVVTALLAAAEARAAGPLFSAPSGPTTVLIAPAEATFSVKMSLTLPRPYTSVRLIEFVEEGLALKAAQIIVNGQTVKCGNATPPFKVRCDAQVDGRRAITVDNLDPSGTQYQTNVTTTFVVQATAFGLRHHEYKGTCEYSGDPVACRDNASLLIDYTVKEFRLGVTKTGPASAAVGQPFEYTVTVTNTEAVEAFGVTVTDALPADLEAVAVVAPAGGQSFGPGASVSALGADGEVRIVAQPAWSVSVRPPGSGGRGPPGYLAAAGSAGASFSFVIRVKTRYGVDPQTTQSVSNVARARAAQPDGPEVASAPAVVRLGATTGGMSLTKKAFGPDAQSEKEVKAGDRATFRLTLSRDATVTGPVTVVDPVPAGVRVTAVVSAGTRRACPTQFAIGALQVSCGAPAALPAVPVRIMLLAGQTLDGAGSTIVDLEALVLPSAAPGPLTNTATVTDAGGLARQAQDSLTVRASGTAGVNLSFRAERAVATKGEVVPFTATLGFYQAFDPAGGILQVSVPLPRDFLALPGTGFLRTEGGSSFGAVTQAAVGDQVIFTLPRRAVAAGTVLLLTFRARVALRAAEKLHHPRADLVVAGTPPRALASATAAVRVHLDPDLDLATVLGDVYRDENGNGWRDPGEPGVPGVLVVMEDGLQAFTDDDGRYHIGAVRPGQRVVKLAPHMLPPGAAVTTDQVRVLTLTPGIMAKVDFGVRIPLVKPTALPADPPATEAASLKARAGGGYSYVMTGALPRGARLRVGGGALLTGAWLTAKVDKSGPYAGEVPLVPGRNRLALVVHAADGVVTVFARDVFLVSRPSGGDLVVPRPAAARLALRFPPGSHAGQDLLLEGSAPGSRPSQLRVSGVDILPDVRGRFGVRIRLPRDAASAGVPVEAAFPDGFRVRFVHDMSAGGDFLLLVGIAEGQLGYVKSTNKASGRDGLYASGRVALYAKGQIQGKYLVEAGVDIDDSIRSAADLVRGDPRAVFRSLDPVRYYPVYGDAGATVAGAERTGRLFVAMKLGASEIVLGNFTTGLTGVELGRYSRSLSGGRAEIILASRRKGEPPRTRVVVFGAWLQTQRAHDEVRGTGGSLYFLRHKEVVEGSEQVRLEVRDGVTNLPLSSTPLRAGVDYEIDTLGGRVILRAPVSTSAASSTVVRSTPHAGDTAWVIVDYEYVVVDPADDGSLGARLQQRVGPVRVGATFVNEFRGGTDYTLAGVDLALSFGRFGQLLFEYAYSSGRLDGLGVSLDGGLTFRDRRTPQTDPTRVYTTWGNAFKAEGQLRAGEGKWGVEARPYFRLVQRGFTDTAHVDERDLLQYGGEVVARGPFGLKLVGRYDERHYSGADPAADAWRRDVEGQVRGTLGRFGLALAFRLEEGRDAYEDGGRTAVALKAEYPVLKRLKLYALYQQCAWHHGTGLISEDNTLGVAGAEVKVIKQYLTAKVEGGYGAQGPTAGVGLQSDLGPGRVLYGSYTFSVDGDDRLMGTFATGGRQKADGTRAELFAEDQYRRDAYERMQAQVAGVQLPLWKVLTLTATYEHGKLDDGATMTERDAGTAGVGYAGGRVRAQAKAEIRRDHVWAVATPDGLAADPAGTTSTGEAATPTTPPGERLQLLGAGALTVRAGAHLWLRGRVMYTRTIAHDGVAERKPEIEGTVGFAWRPPYAGLAVLGRYTYLVDHPASVDDPLVPVYRQRSHIASLAFEVRLWRWLSIGEKVGFKGLREWDANPAVDPGRASEQKYLLWINRLMWHMTKKWDAAAEYRFLFTLPRLVGENDHGVLVEINRIIVGHLRIGAGWNFSAVPTDERAMGRYREHGFFVRAQGFL
ncbi:MAG: DUF11 domain-containing protein [Deltaproteobacteria bacterium]|nr:DUF11 domain-containing protein [Deltaproteobacteria bacterium]